MFIMFMFIYSIRNILLTMHTFTTSAIERSMDSILQQSDYIASLSSPTIALIQSRECQASLYTLINVIDGGQSTIDYICGIDTERLKNILSFQEKQIRDHLYEELPE